jgi:hypothetical protein
MASIDGIRLDIYQPGYRYEVGNIVGAFLLAEGFAKPVTDEHVAMDVPARDFDTPRLIIERRPPAPKTHRPPQLVRDRTPPAWEQFGVAADFERRTRRRR